MPSTTDKLSESAGDVLGLPRLSQADKEAVQKLMNSVQIENVVLAQSHSEKMELPTGAIRVAIQQQATGGSLDDGKMVRSVVRFRLQATLPEDENTGPLFTIEAIFHAYYELKESIAASDVALNEFAAVNGTFNLWPYWREFVQSMSMRMGLPAITIPSFRVSKAWTDMTLSKSESEE